MAYVVGRPNGSWEIRETVSTPAGPRSRTLTSFRELSQATVDRAVARASKPLDAEKVRRAARRAGAPVGLAPADRAAAELLSELADGRNPHPILRGLLLDALREAQPLRIGDPPHEGEDPTAEILPFESPHNAQASAAWLTATPEERGTALEDLLDLADRLPGKPAGRMQRERFPRLEPAA